MRVNTSRPSSSVPNQCSADGFANSFFGFWSVGAYRLSGAATTSRTISKRTIAERNASRCRRKRRQIKAVRLSGPADAERIDSEVRTVSIIANARVEESVDNIGDLVEEQGERSVDHHHGKQDGVVATFGGIPEETSHPGPGKNRFNEDGAAEDGRQIKGDQRDKGQERIPQRMAEVNRTQG